MEGIPATLSPSVVEEEEEEEKVLEDWELSREEEEGEALEEGWPSLIDMTHVRFVL